MTRTELINYFIGLRNFKKYLEISVHNEQNNFAVIQCQDKIIIPGDQSDYFFENNHDAFEIIFIDGIHTEEQAINDIRNSLNILSQNGVIIIHDCLPPDEWHQRDPEDFHEGENWNGTVWKAALRIFNDTCFKCDLLDTDWGCAIIDSSEKQVPEGLLLPRKLHYNTHFDALLKYKKAVSVYLRKYVKLFYHLACMGNWVDVFREQMQLLQQNGFFQIDMTVLGTENDRNTLKQVCDGYNIRSNIIFYAQEMTNFETPALLAIEEYAKQNEGYVLYLHSKGVSSPMDETKIKWRRLMMHELVEKWESCMLQLPHYDVIGVNWREMNPTSHFCGNFWYASTRYLRRLCDFISYYENPRYKIWDAIYNKRLGCEFWISSGTTPPRVLSLFCTNVDFCNPNFWRNK
ncbi:MAG TPA: class I SAM-dependent methyltransferase [Chitinophagaceae bacterium]|jgi:methyltransferase family protein|nr:class I SAM-dependent methyltransferase [Chitinophagaceae bacterium]